MARDYLEIAIFMNKTQVSTKIPVRVSDYPHLRCKCAKKESTMSTFHDYAPQVNKTFAGQLLQRRFL